ncbi:MAG: nucleoside-diphosphate sugar epimerase [Bacteroidetes bacterium HGW-Bacteroidetes-22]|nr:MAG: nucleoside-diphosphate sugar epimerase [Bacteroidetes bacterium HGW-Bacteroidetes-22]
MLNINKFISDSITKRKDSFFTSDLTKFHDELSKAIGGKSILVIGGAGTIGSSYIRSVLKYKPSKLYVADISENSLTELTRDLRSTSGGYVPGDYKTYPINYNDDVFYRMLSNEDPFDIVANFSAHKHVRSEKDHYSITALLENNVIRAEKFMRVLAQNPPEHFFCVSTDKAANPVNIMGASKKMMEEMIMAYASYFPVTTARFANVAFSNGSLLDGFIQRMMKRQPFAVPTDVKRYFVSPDESGQICMMACMLGQTGEIFFPKLEEHQLTSFSDITEAFVKSMGMEVLPFDSEQDAREYAAVMPEDTKFWPVCYFNSDTSGEKSFEEFFTEGEALDLDTFHSLGVIRNAPRRSLEEIHRMIGDLKNVLLRPGVEKADIVQVMQTFLPNFHHIETGKSLDQKM